MEYPATGGDTVAKHSEAEEQSTDVKHKMQKAVTTMVHLFDAMDDKIDKIAKELESKIDGIYERLDKNETEISTLKIKRNPVCKTKSKLKKRKSQNFNNVNSETSSSNGSVFRPVLKQLERHMTESNAHEEVLVSNHELLMSSIDLSNTLILDEMVRIDGISQSDAEYVRSQPRIKDSTRHLLLLLARYGPVGFGKFLQCLKMEHPFLFEKLNGEFIDLLMKARECKMCVVCKIKCSVEKRDILDTLYSNKIIPAQNVESILKCQNSKQSWNEIVYHVNKDKHGIDILIKALEDKYKHLANELRQSGLQKLSCVCTDKNSILCSEDCLISNPQFSSLRSDISLSATLVSSDNSITLVKQIGKWASTAEFTEYFHKPTTKSVDLKNLHFWNENFSQLPISNMSTVQEFLCRVFQQDFDSKASSRHLSLLNVRCASMQIPNPVSKSLPAAIKISNVKADQGKGKIMLWPRDHAFRKAFRKPRTK